MSYLDWKVGDRVVCISESYTPTSAPVDGDVIPREGRLYTIRGFHKSGNLWLVEICNPRRAWRSGRHEYAFHPSRFRKVQPRKTDISIFEAMLHRAPSNAEREKA